MNSYHVSINDDMHSYRVYVHADSEKAACVLVEEMVLKRKDWSGWPEVTRAALKKPHRDGIEFNRFYKFDL